MNTTQLLPGVFTVNAEGKKVRFSRGNLFWDGKKFDIEEHQYDYPTTWKPDHIGYFHYSESINIAKALLYEGLSTYEMGEDVLFAANGGAIDGYTVLTADEWQYLIEHNMPRKNAVTIAGITCSVLVPNDYTGNIAESYSVSEWKQAEMNGLVAIPHAGYYIDGRYESVGISALCWSSSLHIECHEIHVYQAYFTRDEVSVDHDAPYFNATIRLVASV